MKKKIFILGASGLVGNKIIDAAKQKYDVYGTFNKREIKNLNCTISKLDVTEDEQVTKLLSEIKPDVVINTTAFHNVDLCENEQDKSINVNTKFVTNLQDHVPYFE